MATIITTTSISRYGHPPLIERECPRYSDTGTDVATRPHGVPNLSVILGGTEMAEYGRDWSRRRGRGWRSRRGFAHDDDFERRAEPYGIGRTRRGRRPYFTGFRREAGIADGICCGAGVGLNGVGHDCG